MNIKIIKYSFTVVFCIALLSLGFRENEKNQNRLNKVTINDNYNYIAINQVLMYVSNNGDGSHDPKTDGNGFYWPGGINATKSAIFEDGLIWAGKVGKEVRMNGNTHRQGLQAGKILESGLPDDPSLTKYRVYKIRKGWESLPDGPARRAYKKDYEEWPIEDGAPYEIDETGKKVPQFISDEVLWYVANDMDPARSTFTYGSQPIGLEFQTTIFGFNRTGPLGDMVFKKYKIINKGGNKVTDFYLGYWSDTDLGYAGDDYTGCDTILSLGYTYNGDNNDDGVYGTPPPAVGYDFFQGPIVPYDVDQYPIIKEKNLPDSGKFDGKWIKGKTNLPMTAFAYYINGNTTYRDPAQGNYTGTLEFYNYLQGLVWNGNPYIDPNTGLATKFVCAGDPVAGKGWYEGKGWPGGPDPDDRRHLMSSGPFTLAPSDTQEVVVGILIAQGTSNINSVAVLKSTDEAAQKAYDLDFKLTPPPTHPAVSFSGLDKKIVFYWDKKVESYSEIDKLITGRKLADTTYDFEGYEIYQYRDIAGTDPVLLATYDLENDITKILDMQSVQGENVLLPVAAGSNTGLFRAFELTEDSYSKKALNNGTPYYIGVVAYGYCPNSSPKVLKSTHRPIEVFPQSPSAGTSYLYNYGDFVDFEQVSGISEGFAKIKVIDPNALTGDRYRITFSKNAGKLIWNLINVTKSDTLLRNQAQFLTYTDLRDNDVTTLTKFIEKNNTVIDGFVVGVADPGSAANLDRIREVVLLKDAGKDVKASGNLVSFVPRKGLNIFGRSTAYGWWIAGIDPAGSPINSMQNLNFNKVAAENDFEIRFTSDADASEFYAPSPGFTTDLLRSNPKSKTSKVPLQFWNVGNKSNPLNLRHYIKVYDTKQIGIKDTLWNSTVINKDLVRKDSIQFEELYFMRPLGTDSTYTYPMPDPSGISRAADYPIGKFTIMTKSADDFPKAGTVVKIFTWKGIKDTEVFEFTAIKPKINDLELAKTALDKINVFPNPYFGANALERDKYQRFVRFTNLPNTVTVRIFTISGVFINKLEKQNTSQFLDWDLRNQDGIPVASGMYIAHLDMPGIGTKVMKIAVIMETQYIDRL
ncbi:MAG: hypothetical protein KJ666_16515 [Bacteroidetes bacterium]|nr:hypothetical protein [Bacteroidota bacterium]MBU2586078.1 hypothetical protein [Bacteroidota bacterium]